MTPTCCFGGQRRIENKRAPADSKYNQYMAWKESWTGRGQKELTFTPIGLDMPHAPRPKCTKTSHNRVDTPPHGSNLRIWMSCSTKIKISHNARQQACVLQASTRIRKLRWTSPQRISTGNRCLERALREPLHLGFASGR